MGPATTMTMHAATMLRFVKFPSVSNRPQQTADGRAWQIVQVEAPFCWARPHGSSEPLRQYLVQGKKRLRAATGPRAQARPGEKDGVRAGGGIRTDAGAARAGRSAALSKASRQVRLHRYGSECDCIGRSRPARLSHCGAGRRRRLGRFICIEATIRTRRTSYPPRPGTPPPGEPSLHQHRGRVQSAACASGICCLKAISAR